jgi:hypothetical protein
VLLTVATAPDLLTATAFTFVIPGAQQWYPRSVCATVATAPGGINVRSYLLQITDGTNLVAQVGAADGNVDPATGTVTWANAPAALSATTGQFSSLGPLPDLVLNPGYVITGTILNPFGADTWVSAVVWYDFRYTDGR